MLGAIAGDIIGSIYEYSSMKSKDFPFFRDGCEFTDDTILTVAVADALMSGEDFAVVLKRWGRWYPDADYGGRFKRWLSEKNSPSLDSYGNGSAMRVSPVGWVARSAKDARKLAKRSAMPTHGHPDAVAGAQAVATAMWMARKGHDVETIRRAMEKQFGYDLSRTVAEVQKGYGYDVRCIGTVPPALISVFEAKDYEDAVRNAVSLDGDADTLACIAGGLAEVLFGLPGEIEREALSRLDDRLRKVVLNFVSRHVRPTLLGRFATVFSSPGMR